MLGWKPVLQLHKSVHVVCNILQSSLCKYTIKNHFALRNVGCNFATVCSNTCKVRCSFSLAAELHTSTKVMADNKYCVEYAKRGTAGCKKCKQKIDKGLPRIAKIVANPFSEDGGDMKQWYHINCIFETFQVG